MELHVWSPVKSAFSLEPTCLASVYLCELHSSETKLIQSSNASFTSDYRLPVLCLPKDEFISSFYDICAYLLPEIDEKDTAFISYLLRISRVAYSQLFIPGNYEVVRSQITQHTAFPLQYTVPLKLKKDAYEFTTNKLNLYLNIANDFLKQWEKPLDEYLADMQTLPPSFIFLGSILIILCLDLPKNETKAFVEEHPDLVKLKDSLQAVRISGKSTESRVSGRTLKYALHSVVT